MLRSEHLDVRTVTMGISLFDCAAPDFDTFAYKVRSKILRNAEKLVETCDIVGDRYGIPVVNKRISVSPMATVCAGFTRDQMVEACRVLDDCAKDVGVDFIGGFGALVEKGMTPGERNLIDALPEALATTDRICSSINVGSTKAGINMDAVKLMGERILDVAAATADRDAIGCAKLVVFCNIPQDVPFMAGAYLGVADLSLAPTPAVGDSVGEIFQTMGLSSIGAPGTTAILAMLNDAVKKGGVFASSHVGGLSGAFIPVSEDSAIEAAARSGALTMEKLEAMTSVCSVGLDMIAIPGDTSAATISGMIADEMAIGMINSKTTAVRIIPVPGKGVGEKAVFGGLLGEAAIIRVPGGDSTGFVKLGGRIPAPIHSLKN